ncbi:MAG: hypothetical protein AMXMBFR33_68040 [Candidatus Xenobia bacterium]
MRKLTFGILLWMVTGWALADEPVQVSQFGNSQPKHQITVAIEFLDEMSSPWARECRRQLNGGRYYHWNEGDSQTNWDNTTYIDEDLLFPNLPDPVAGVMKQPRWDRKQCPHFQHIARLAVTLVHEQVHSGQSLPFRAKEGIDHKCGGNHEAEQHAWSVAFAEMDRWIRKYKKERLTSTTPNLKKLQEERDLITLKLEMMSSYGTENEPKYGPLLWEVIRKKNGKPLDPPPDPVPDPKSAIEQELNDQLVEVGKCIDTFKLAEVKGEEPKIIHAPEKPEWEEQVKHPPGAWKDECREELRVVSDGSVELKTSNQTERKIQLELACGTILLVGERLIPVVVAEAVRVELEPRGSAEAKVPVYSLREDDRVAPGSSVHIEVHSSRYLPILTVLLKAEELKLGGKLQHPVPEVTQAALWRLSEPGVRLDSGLLQEADLVIRACGLEQRLIERSPNEKQTPEGPVVMPFWCVPGGR